MKRRSFLKLLGIAPALPLSASTLTPKRSDYAPTIVKYGKLTPEIEVEAAKWKCSPANIVKKPIRWRRYKPFTPSLKPMAEGDAPAIFTQKLEYEDTVELTP